MAQDCIFDENNEEIYVYEDDFYISEVDIKKLLADILKKDITLNDSIELYFQSDEEILAYVSYVESIIGGSDDFTKLSEKECILYRLCLDEICSEYEFEEYYIWRKIYLCMSDINGNPYELDYEEAKALLKLLSRESVGASFQASFYLSLFAYVDYIRKEEILPYIVESHLRGLEESECALVEAYLCHLDGMIIDTDFVVGIIDSHWAKGREEFRNGHFETAYAYACYEKYRLLAKDNKKDTIKERQELLEEAKRAIEKRIGVQESKFTIIFDKQLLRRIESKIEDL